MSTHEHTVLEGVLERFVYTNDETHYCIAEFKPSREKAFVTITGVLPSVQCGETLKLQGMWINHTQYGRQFKIQNFQSKLPSTVHGIRKYLGSGLVPGVGKTYANKIVDHFGEDTLRVISEESARLREVGGIGQHRARAIKKAWDDQHAVRDVMMFLKTYGVSTAQCLRLVRAYGNNAKEIIRNNPYKLAEEIHGIGFKTADAIARNVGISNESEDRIRAGILYAMKTLEGEGHTIAHVNQLVKLANELLDVDEPLIEPCIELCCKGSWLTRVEDPDYVQLSQTQVAEMEIAQSLNRLNREDSTLPPIKIEKAIEWAQEGAGFDFAPAQAEAIRAALANKLSIITGGPGTGKTTILRAVVSILKAKKVSMVLAAPTGRAAQRMAESTGMTAHTIHRLLKYDFQQGGFLHNAQKPLSAQYVIIDESSMLDTKLAASLFQAIPGYAHVVLVGDVHQLPSVGPGRILEDCIQSKLFQVTRLNEIFRQQSCSSIVTTAHGILAGNSVVDTAYNQLGDVAYENDFNFIQADTPEATMAAIQSLYTDYLKKWYGCDPIKDVQILAPMHRGTVGIAQLNLQLQKALNPQRHRVAVGHNQYGLGDKVLQTRNNYDKNIFNGDLGVVSAVNAEAHALTVRFEDEEVELERLELSDVQLAYAISIHKSQGSEFPIVIIPLLKQHYVMLQRNLIYTAITRGRKKVFLVGDPTAYGMAVRNTESTIRNTGLLKRL